MPKRRWRSAEIAEVVRRYEAEGPDGLARDLGRSVPSVTSQANHLGMRSGTRRTRQARTRRRRRLTP